MEPSYVNKYDFCLASYTSGIMVPSSQYLSAYLGNEGVSGSWAGNTAGPQVNLNPEDKTAGTPN